MLPPSKAHQGTNSDMYGLLHHTHISSPSPPPLPPPLPCSLPCSLLPSLAPSFNSVFPRTVEHLLPLFLTQLKDDVSLNIAHFCAPSLQVMCVLPSPASLCTYVTPPIVFRGATEHYLHIGRRQQSDWDRSADRDPSPGHP